MYNSWSTHERDSFGSSLQRGSRVATHVVGILSRIVLDTFSVCIQYRVFPGYSREDVEFAGQWVHLCGCASSDVAVTAVMWLWRQWCGCDRSNVAVTEVMWLWQNWCGCDRSDVAVTEVMWLWEKWCGCDRSDVAVAEVIWLWRQWCGYDGSDVAVTVVMWLWPQWCGCNSSDNDHFSINEVKLLYH